MNEDVCETLHCTNKLVQHRQGRVRRFCPVCVDKRHHKGSSEYRLAPKTCENPPCNNIFKMGPRGSYQKYCCPACAKAMMKIKQKEYHEKRLKEGSKIPYVNAWKNEGAIFIKSFSIKDIPGRQEVNKAIEEFLRKGGVIKKEGVNNDINDEYFDDRFKDSKEISNIINRYTNNMPSY